MVKRQTSQLDTSSYNKQDKQTLNEKFCIAEYRTVYQSFIVVFSSKDEVLFTLFTLFPIKVLKCRLPKRIQSGVKNKHLTVCSCILFLQSLYKIQFFVLYKSQIPHTHKPSGNTERIAVNLSIHGLSTLSKKRF